MFRILEAETYLKAGRDEAALRAIEQALLLLSLASLQCGCGGN